MASHRIANSPCKGRERGLQGHSPDGRAGQVIDAVNAHRAHPFRWSQAPHAEPADRTAAYAPFMGDMHAYAFLLTPQALLI